MIWLRLFILPTRVYDHMLERSKDMGPRTWVRTHVRRVTTTNTTLRCDILSHLKVTMLHTMVLSDAKSDAKSDVTTHWSLLIICVISFMLFIPPITNLKFLSCMLILFELTLIVFFYEILSKSFCSWLMSKDYVFWNFFYGVLIPLRTNLKFHSCMLIPFE